MTQSISEITFSYSDAVQAMADYAKKKLNARSDGELTAEGVSVFIGPQGMKFTVYGMRYKPSNAEIISRALAASAAVPVKRETTAVPKKSESKNRRTKRSPTTVRVKPKA